MDIKKRERTDWLMKQAFKAAGLVTIGLLGGIFIMLLYNSVNFFLDVKPFDFFTGSQWDPESAKSKYSIMPLLASTGMVALDSMIIAVPLGIFTAAFLSEMAHPKLRAVLKPWIEMLAAIPSVTIGFLGIVLVGPGIAKIFGISNGLNALNGSVLLAVMALPTIITISEDAINAVPKSHREASLALGVLRPEVILMDEPCSSLDPISTNKIEELINSLKKDYTIVIVTHNMQQAQRISNTVAFMYLGELIEFDTCENIFKSPKQELTKNYVGGHFG